MSMLKMGIYFIPLPLYSYIAAEILPPVTFFLQSGGNHNFSRPPNESAG
jgi:hypothetical protein